MGLMTILRDRGARWVLGGWTLFTLENVILSENREAIRRAWGGAGGQGAYQQFYSLLSATTLGSTCYAYWRYARHSLVVRSMPRPPQARVLAMGLRAAGLVAMGQLAPPINFGAASIALGLSTPPEHLSPAAKGAMGCPFDFNAQRDRGEVFGIMRVTRRPELFGLAAVGLGGAVLAETAAGICFFGVGPVLCFGALAAHSDRVQRASGDLSETKEAQTSVLPFVAVLDGRQSWSSIGDELVRSNAAAGVGFAVLWALRPHWLRWVR